MTLKLKPRERLLAATTVGGIKLAMTSENYGAMLQQLAAASKSLEDLRTSISGYPAEKPQAAVK